MEQGLRQRCVQSLLLFNILFAAVLTVVLRRFRNDTAILAKRVDLKEPPTSMGLEPAMNYVRRVVWGMLYVDDACIVSRSPEGPAKMMEVIIRGLPSPRPNRVGEKEIYHVHTPTAYTADDGASRSGRPNV